LGALTVPHDQAKVHGALLALAAPARDLPG
jgi:hypothetical protein